MIASDVTGYLNQLFADNGAIEVRHNPKPKVWESYWFDNLPDLSLAVSEIKHQGALYTSLNAPRVKVINNGRQQQSLKDDQVAFITRLPFDFDPERPTGTASTNDELGEAELRCLGLAKYLQKIGWPLPCLGLSGNGWHAQYRCRLPNDADTKMMLTTIYRGMSAQFSDDVIKFDVSVRNPGRIFRLYGTENRKGLNTVERPYRQTAVYLPPHGWQQVTRRQVERLANFFEQQKPARTVRPAPQYETARGGASGRGDYRTLDIVAWFHAHGLYEHAIDGNKHAVTCPWESEHSESHHNDTLIFEPDGGHAGFFCHHSHCQGRNVFDVVNQLGDADAYCTANWRASK